MAFYKNKASQKIAVYAHDTAADAPKTGDAANITAQISKDGAATAATNDAAPSELDATDAPGIYLFDMTQAETNAELIILSAVSSTADVQIEPVIIYTETDWRTLLGDSGTAQSGASTTITLAATANANNDYYKDAVVAIGTGTGAGQARQITAYDGSSKVATVDTAWVTNPDSSSTYQITGRIV